MSNRTKTKNVWCPPKQRSALVTFSVEGRFFPRITSVDSCPAKEDPGDRCDMRCIAYPKTPDRVIYGHVPYH